MTNNYLWFHVATYKQDPAAMLKLLWNCVDYAEHAGWTIVPALEPGQRKQPAWDTGFRAGVEATLVAGDRRQVVVRADADGPFGIHEFLSRRRLSAFTLSVAPPELHNAKNLAALGKPQVLEILSLQRNPLSLDAVFRVPALECEEVGKLTVAIKTLVVEWADTDHIALATVRRFSEDHLPTVSERATPEEVAVGLDWEVARQMLDVSVRGPAMMWWLSEAHVAAMGGETALQRLPAGFTVSMTSGHLHLVEAPPDFREYENQAVTRVPAPLAMLLPRRELRDGLKLTSDYLDQFRPKFSTAPNPPSRPIR